MNKIYCEECQFNLRQCQCKNEELKEEEEETLKEKQTNNDFPDELSKL